MARIDTIRTEIEGAAYQGEPDWRVAEALNAPVLAGRVAVPVAKVASWITAQGLWYDLETAAREHASTDVRRAATAALRSLEPARFSVVDFVEDATSIEASILALELGGVLTEAQAIGFLALGDGLVSRAYQLGLGRVEVIEISNARRAG